MTKEQNDYIEQMELWFKGEKYQNDITSSNIDNAEKMISHYNNQLSHNKDLLEFDLKRQDQTKQAYNQWCDDNGLSDYKKQQ